MTTSEMNRVLDAIDKLREDIGEIKESIAGMPSKEDHNEVRTRISNLENWRSGIVMCLGLAAFFIAYVAEHVGVFG
jgi:hypothetical protein